MCKKFGAKLKILIMHELKNVKRSQRKNVL